MALWREALLAKKVLEARTKGYKHHPQLKRFRNSIDPLVSINIYLSHVLEEAARRGYSFNLGKISWEKCEEDFPLITVTSGQMQFERKHLITKLSKRDKIKCKEVELTTFYDPHPLFEVVEGDVEAWEILE